MSKHPIFEPNLNRLDEEWMAYPAKYHAAAVELTDAIYEHDLAKAAIDVRFADTCKDIRERPEVYGIDVETLHGGKLNNDVVLATAKIQKSYQKAISHEIECKRLVGLARAQVDAMDALKYALLKLVDLRLADYNSELHPRREARQETNKMREERTFRFSDSDNSKEEIQGKKRTSKVGQHP